MCKWVRICSVFVVPLVTYAFFVSIVMVLTKIEILGLELKVIKATDLSEKYTKLSLYYCVWASIINIASGALLVVAFF